VSNTQSSAHNATNGAYYGFASQAPAGAYMTRVLFPVQSTKWAEQIADAKALDRYAVEKHGQRDRDHHLCSMQRQQQRDGYVQIEIGTWIGGYAVRDTINDGLGTLAGGRIHPGMTQAEAIEWARNWHAEDPTRREVIAGYGFVHSECSASSPAKE
jgi:hypothetical protein